MYKVMALDAVAWVALLGYTVSSTSCNSNAIEQPSFYLFLLQNVLGVFNAPSLSESHWDNTSVSSNRRHTS